jgi:hypothetical protein
VWDELVTKACTYGELEHGAWIIEASTHCEWKLFITPFITHFFVAATKDVDDDDATEAALDLLKTNSTISDVGSWDHPKVFDEDDSERCMFMCQGLWYVPLCL